VYSDRTIQERQNPARCPLKCEGISVKRLRIWRIGVSLHPESLYICSSQVKKPFRFLNMLRGWIQQQILDRFQAA
jgi:hypothetical protein